FFQLYLHLRHLPSFPTRRSSDLSRLRNGADGRDQYHPDRRREEARRTDHGAVGGQPSGRSDQEDPYELVGQLAVRLTGFDEQARSEEHTSELQSRSDLVCRLLLE